MGQQRTLVLLESPMRKAIEKISRTQGISISSLCRDLIREALEIYEDSYWAEVARAREKGFNWSKGLSHTQVWGKKRTR